MTIKIRGVMKTEILRALKRVSAPLTVTGVKKNLPWINPGTGTVWRALDDLQLAGLVARREVLRDPALQRGFSRRYPYRVVYELTRRGQMMIQLLEYVAQYFGLNTIAAFMLFDPDLVVTAFSQQLFYVKGMRTWPVSLLYS